MTTHDDDFLTSPVPEPDAEATPSERAHAKTFADIVDKDLYGFTEFDLFYFHEKLQWTASFSTGKTVCDIFLRRYDK